MTLLALDKWGPAGWHFLHAITFTYPINPSDAIKAQYRRFFATLPAVLPCKICQRHLQENYSSLPINLASRQTLSEWLVNIHNQVNASKGKAVWTYPQVVKMYLPPAQYASVGLTPAMLAHIVDPGPAAASCASSSSSSWIWITAILGLFVVALLIFIGVMSCRNRNVRLLTSG